MKMAQFICNHYQWQKFQELGTFFGSTSFWFRSERYSVHAIPQEAENGTRNLRMLGQDLNRTNLSGIIPKLNNCNAGHIFQLAKRAGMYIWNKCLPYAHHCTFPLGSRNYGGLP